MRLRVCGAIIIHVFDLGSTERMSPTVLDDDTYYYRFYSRDRPHHPHDLHVHVVKRDRTNAKFGLDPVELVHSVGVGKKELNEIRRRVIRHEGYLPRKWYEFFG